MLFAPGDHERRLQRVGDFGSDLIVLDLEDAVAPERKDVARGMIRRALPGYVDQRLVGVRVNSLPSGRAQEDLGAVVCPDLDLVVAPKVESVEDLRRFGEMIAAAERDAGIAPDSIRLIPQIETAVGVARSEEIAAAASPRVLTFAFGAADFASDMRFDLTPDATEILYARSRLLVAVRAAGLPSPLDGPFLQLQEDEGLLVDTRRSRQLGFQGRVVIHPRQVEPVQRAYSELSPSQVSAAQRVVQEFESAQAAGISSLQVEGQFVDLPVYERARQRLLSWTALNG